MSVFTGIRLPKVIYKTESKYNGVIEVLEATDGARKVMVEGFAQSVCKNTKSARIRVWGKLVEVLKEEEPNLTRVLILGLGGGNIQHLLSQDVPGVSIVSVEIDPVMIDVAKKFFYLDDIPNHRIINDDAYRVVVEPDKFGLDAYSFDAVVADAFIGDKVSDLASSGNFLAALKRLVKPVGLVVFNRVYLHRHQDDVDNFVELLEEFFRNIESRTVAGHTNSDNLIIYGRT